MLARQIILSRAELNLLKKQKKTRAILKFNNATEM